MNSMCGAEPFRTPNFTYDAWGNLYSIAVERCSVPTLSAAVDAATNRLTGNGYAYDGAGNMINDGGHAYTYDAEGRIVTAAGVTYTYDGDGKRVKKSSGKLYWTGMGTDPLDESDLSGTVNEEYVFFNGKRIARLDLPSAVVHYYFSDHLGSASAVTDATGSTIQDESDYYPFGGERAIVTSDPNPYKFTGKERDSESGLDYFGARYYGSTLGRWLSPDWNADPSPIPYADLSDPQSLNLYGYVDSNPLSSSDPNGHCAAVLDCVVEIGAAAGQGISWAASGAVAGVAVLGSLAYAEITHPLTIQGGGSTFGIGADGGYTRDVILAQQQAATQKGQSAQAAQGQSTPALPKPPSGPGKAPKEQRDKKRTWSKQQNASKLEQQGGRCANCGEAKNIDEVEGHHIDRHADGGSTNDQNHAVVCQDCHDQLHSREPNATEPQKEPK